MPSEEFSLQKRNPDHGSWAHPPCECDADRTGMTISVIVVKGDSV